MTYPIDKLGVIVNALLQTGDNTPAAADDGSEEWNICSAAYESFLEYALDSADWKQTTKVITLNSTGVPPMDDMFDTAYAKPTDCVHVIWVRADDLPVIYQILNNQIVLNQFGQAPGIPAPPGATPITATMKYVSSDLVPTTMLRTFFTAMERYVMSGIYRGLHKDPTNAREEEKASRLLLQEARTRSDQEQSKRAVWNSRLTASRRVRRPWPVVPTGWGGTGSPG